MNESKDNGQLQNKHASSKPKESEKGDACTLVCFFVLCETSRESGSGGAGVLDGPPLSPQRTPPSASASVALEHHGYSSSYLVRSHDALELSFRSERSQLPGLALWAACAAASATGNTGNIAPKTENLLGKCRAPNAFRSPRGEQRGFLQRRDRSPNECTHQVRFSSVREPTTTYGRIAEELLKNCEGRRPLCWV